MEVFLSIVSLLFMVSIIGFLVYVEKRSKEQTKKRIAEEEAKGNKCLYRKNTGGVIDGIRYRGSFLTLVVFEDFFIIKDKKVMFEDIASISQSVFSGTTITLKNKQIIVLGNGKLPKFIPKEYGGNKE